MRYSIGSIREKRLPAWQSRSVPELIVGETEDFFMLLNNNAQQADA
jgi:hypothetical protein